MLVRPEDRPDVVALVPTLVADVDRLQACLAATAAQETARRLAIVCVVNSPLPLRLGSVANQIRVLVAGVNLGWPGGLVFARSQADAPLLWLVQDDVRAAPDCLDHLLARLEADDQCALASPVTLQGDDVVPAFSAGGVLGGGVMQFWHPSYPTPLADLDPVQLAALSFVPSRGALVRTAAWDAVGGMDPRYYPVMWADVDLCRAFTLAGYGFAVVTSAHVAHEGRGSTGNDFGQFLAGRNASLFAQKWFAAAGGETVPPDPPHRPTPPDALNGRIHPEISRDLLATVAQASADTLVHLGRNYRGTSADAARYLPPPPWRRAMARLRRVATRRW